MWPVLRPHPQLIHARSHGGERTWNGCGETSISASTSGLVTLSHLNGCHPIMRNITPCGNNVIMTCLVLPLPQSWETSDDPVQRPWRELSSNHSCYTLKAGKGGKTVIWGREDYRKEGLRQLGKTKSGSSARRRRKQPMPLSLTAKPP